MMSPHTAELASPAADEDPSAHAGDAAAHIRERLHEQVPELFEGRLPSYLARRMESDIYALGNHQGAAGAATIEEAAAFLNKPDGGITTRFDGASESLARRFLMFGDIDLEPEGTADNQRALIDRHLTMGFYSNPAIGRFIYAFPVKPEALAEVRGVPRRAPELPWYGVDENNPDRHEGDLFMDDLPNRPLNAKYCAGFIDRDGTFHPNAHFMRDSTFAPTTIDAMKLADVGIVKIDIK